MKQLVCDFCDSLRLGIKLGYKEFDKTFTQARQVREIAKNTGLLKCEIYKVEDCVHPNDAKVQTVRELAQKNYKGEK